MSAATTDSFFLRELFLQQLPANFRMVLASADVSMDMGKLTDMADKVMEVAVPTVAAIPSSTATNSQEVQQLRQVVARLTELVTSLTTSSCRRRSSGHSCTPSPSTRTLNPTKSEGLCWYHAKFGENAKKYKEPCAWEEKDITVGIQVILPLFTFSTSLTKKHIYDFWWTLDQNSVSFPPLICFGSETHTRQAQFDSHQEHSHSHVWKAITQPQPWPSPSLRLGIHHRRHPQTDHRI